MSAHPASAAAPQPPNAVGAPGSPCQNKISAKGGRVQSFFGKKLCSLLFVLAVLHFAGGFG